MSDRALQAGAGVAGTCAVALLVAACGSGAFNAPGGDDDADDPPETTTSATESEGDNGNGDNGNGDNGNGGPEFSIFSLPSGPRTPADVVEDDIYIPLQTGDCTEARTVLDAVWQALKSPRSVLLYEAGVSMCQGDTDGAATWLDGAAAYGWAGIDAEFFVLDADGQDAGTYRYDCELYRSIVGVLELVSRDSVSCESGVPPAWPEEFPRQDPRGGPAETTDPDNGEVTESPKTDGPTTDGPTTDGPTTDTSPTTSSPAQG
jgi:hypothetical protein